MATLSSVGFLRKGAAHRLYHTVLTNRLSSGEAHPSTSHRRSTALAVTIAGSRRSCRTRYLPHSRASAPHRVLRAWSTSARPPTSTDAQEAARRHREIQNLMQGPTPTSAPSGTVKAGAAPSMAAIHKKQGEQRRRQAIINATMSFLVVLLAAQGVKNGDDRRKAQEGQQNAERELQNIRNRLRELVASDELARSLARDCVAAMDTTAKNPRRTTMWGAIFSPGPQNSFQEFSDERVHRVAEVLNHGLASHLITLLMTDEERERHDMEELAHYAELADSLVSMTQESASMTDDLDSSSTRSSVPRNVHSGDVSQRPKKVFAF